MLGGTECGEEARAGKAAEVSTKKTVSSGAGERLDDVARQQPPKKMFFDKNHVMGKCG